MQTQPKPKPKANPKPNPKPNPNPNRNPNLNPTTKTFKVKMLEQKPGSGYRLRGSVADEDKDVD